MMTRTDLKMMDSKELRELRSLIGKELDFRADIGQELEGGGIKEWVSATEWSARIQKEKEEDGKNEWANNEVNADALQNKEDWENEGDVTNK